MLLQKTESRKNENGKNGFGGKRFHRALCMSVKRSLIAPDSQKFIMHEPWDWATVAAQIEFWTDIYCSVEIQRLDVGCVKGTGGRGAVASLCVFARDAHWNGRSVCSCVLCECVWVDEETAPRPVEERGWFNCLCCVMWESLRSKWKQMFRALLSASPHTTNTHGIPYNTRVRKTRNTDKGKKYSTIMTSYFWHKVI